MLICTVRNCQLPLRREEHRVVCGKGHSFDIARSGYINLLQPQDRRSKNPGDTAKAIAARRRIHDSGVTAPLLAGLEAFARPSIDDVVLDAGSGEGFFLGSLAAHFGCSAHGVDISIPAVDSAAKRYPQCEWIVANADRYLPYSKASFSLVLSITGRLNASEFRRVLQPDGRLIVAVPAPDDLIEIRGKGRNRVEHTIAAAENFSLIQRERIAASAEFDAAAVNDVMHSIYRPLRSEPLRAMRLTFSLDLLEYRRTGHAR